MAGRKFLNGIDLTSQKIVNLASPSASTDAANKSYVDNLVNGLAWKPAVRASTTANGTLSTAYANASVIDGVTLATGDRILLKNQTTGADNGIYTVNASGAPTRALDADGGSELGPNTTVMVSEGTTLADTAWTNTTNGIITIGTTATTWAQVGGGGVYTASLGVQLVGSDFRANLGTGLTLSGNQIIPDSTVVVRRFASTIGDGSTTAIAVTHSLGTRDIHVSVHDASTFEEVECDVVKTSTSVVTLTFATAPASNAYRVTVFG
jgi:hypothetical protein